QQRPGDQRKQPRREREGAQNQQRRAQGERRAQPVEVMLYSIKVEPCPYPPQPVLYLRQGQSFLCAWYPDHGRLLSVRHPSTKGVHNIVESLALVNSDLAGGCISFFW